MSQTSPKIKAIGRLDIGGETTFGTVASNFDYIRTFVVDASSLAVSVIRDEHMRQRDDEVARILGAYRGTVTTKHYLHGFSSSIPSSAPSLTDSSQSGANAHDHLGSIIGSALGNWKLGGYVDSETYGSSGSPVDTVTASDLTSFTVGEPIVWYTGNSALPYYAGWVASNTASTTDEIELLQTTPPYAPSSGGSGQDTYWGASPVVWLPTGLDLDAYHSNASNSATLNQPATSWSLKLYGHDSDDLLTCVGCRPIGVKFMFPLGELPTYEITWGVAHWSEAGSGGAPSKGTYSFPEPQPVLNSWIRWSLTASDGSGGGSLICKDLELEFGITRTEIPDPSKPSGVGGWYTSKRTPTCTFKVYRDLSEEVSRFTNQTALPFTFQHGTQPGKMFVFCIPQARPVEWPSPQEDGAAVMSTVKLEAHSYSADTGTASDIVPINSDLRLAWC